MPKMMFGIDQLKSNNDYIKTLWRHITNPPCPHCNGGVLYLSEGTAPVSDLEINSAWQCRICGYGLIAKDINDVRETVSRIRSEQALANLSQMEVSHRLEVQRSHRIASRFFFSAGAIIYAMSLYLLATGDMWTAFNWFCMGCTFGVFGLTRAYRAWQITTGRLFESGAFLHWIKNEKWFV